MYLRLFKKIVLSLIILGIESSCDETSASVCIDGEIINNTVVTQIEHRKFGGVIPELASRSHQKNIIPIIISCLDDAKVSLGDIDAVAYTQGPGLLGSLLVGSVFAKSMCLALDIPIIPVNHLKAHVLSHFIEHPFPSFPFLCLLVSGGHTQIIQVKSYYEMQILGNTKDDAVGEAFDKCGKLLNLPYPAGPKIDEFAKNGNPHRFNFPKANMPDYNFSFSGIKTSFLYFLRRKIENDKHFIEKNLNDLAASIQHTLVNMLLDKLTLAGDNLGIKEIAIAGGVASNSLLRHRICEEKNKRSWNIHIPKFEYCTDNAAMIAISGYFLHQKGFFGALEDHPIPKMHF